MERPRAAVVEVEGSAHSRCDRRTSLSALEASIHERFNFGKRNDYQASCKGGCYKVGASQLLIAADAPCDGDRLRL